LANSTAANYQPWLRLAETGGTAGATPSLAAFNTVFNLMPSSLSAVSYSGDLNLVGDLTLSPSSNGTVELFSSGSVNGLQKTGVSTSIVNGRSTTVWGASQINLSDASPLSVPGVASPYAYQTYSGFSADTAYRTASNFLSNVNSLFDETGSYTGTNAVLQTKQALHSSGPLHLGDNSPV
jgi:hypothetical protein